MKNIVHKLKHYLKFHNDPAKEKLDVQLKRTLIKKKSVDKKRVEFLIDLLGKYKKFKSGERALFVGCRNPYEISYFKKFNQAKSIGIDLFSESKLIKVMDMHQLEFKDNSFDLIFASHSLEHSHHPQQAVNELIRVLKNNAWLVIEVPVNYETQESDLTDFKNTKTILKLFSKTKATVIWQRLARKGDKLNHSGTDVLSLIIKLNK